MNKTKLFFIYLSYSEQDILNDNNPKKTDNVYQVYVK